MYEDKARILQIIKKNVFYLRKRVLRISLEELSEKTGVAAATIQKLESWSVDSEEDINPTLKSLVAIASFFGIHASDLMFTDIEQRDFDSKINEIAENGVSAVVG
jgi:transcriptional regulator with XRE-family HTH domain